MHGGYAELLANVPERDLPAYRALGRGLELYVRGSDTVLLAAGSLRRSKREPRVTIRTDHFYEVT